MAVLALIGLAPSAATAASGPVFPVMNTSETAPDGVWFRNSPHTADTSRISGLGIYMNERVQAGCWQWGDSVGKYGNQIWYYAYNVTRPSAAGRSNEGWVNTHYVNDGMTANHAAPGVPQCGSTPAPPPTVKSVYYSPSAGEVDPAGGGVVKRIGVSSWSNPSVKCDTGRAIGYLPGTAHTLAGWSLGRLGPIYALARANSGQRQQITTVYLIDPGSYGELASSCDAAKLQTGQFSFQTGGQILASWLRNNPSARLVVMAGDVTADPLHPVNGHGHAGIQNVYFNDVRAAGTSARSRTLVCNYSMPGVNAHDNASMNRSHRLMYDKTNQFIQSPNTTSCPALSGLNQGASWHP
jgi:hypothetical protein